MLIDKTRSPLLTSLLLSETLSYSFCTIIVMLLSKRLTLQTTVSSFGDTDGAMCTIRSYNEPVEFLESGTGGVVDLVKANQRAILAIMDQKPELYHWALFIFNGY